jgi:DNA repair exonuclease SbcCD ATPase subunit
MDAKDVLLKEKLEFHLKEAAAIAAAIQGAEQGKQTPHFDQIEQSAHDLGKRLSRLVQTNRMREVAANGLNDAPCPTCGERCRVSTKARDVSSLDGTIELTETVAKCRRCRRSFFPSTNSVGD